MKINIHIQSIVDYRGAICGKILNKNNQAINDWKNLKLLTCKKCKKMRK